MDLTELIRSRRTIHNYLPQAVPLDVVHTALELSLWAPNHKLSYPWVYTWVGPQARAKLADLAIELKSGRGPLTDVKAKAIRESMMYPSHLISLAVKRSEPHREHEDYGTLSCSVQIASMYLWQQNIGTKWSTGGPWMHERTYEILGLDPATVRLEGGLLIGVAQITPEPPVRPPLAQFLKKSL